LLFVQRIHDFIGAGGADIKIRIDGGMIHLGGNFPTHIGGDSHCIDVGTRIHLAADVFTPGVARSFVGQCLRHWGYESIIPDAELLTSEVVTNAVVHAGGPVVVEVDDLADSVVVVVEDSAATLPLQRSPGPLDDGGRGLQILGALASGWGVSEIPDHGKFVWFRLMTPWPGMQADPRPDS
jgi:anti-sigma regulatory factor (Ser/Thr protein kinase)